MKLAKIITITVVIVLSIWAIFFNITEFFNGGSGSQIGLLASILFVLSWIMMSFLFGRGKKYKYVLFLSIYYGGSVALWLVSYIFLNISESFSYLLFLIPAITILVPLSGLINGFVNHNQILIPLLLIGLVFVLNLALFFVGKFIKNGRIISD